MDKPTLFLSGDYEAQKLCPKGTDIQPFIRKHFIYSILLSSRVNMPVGCYYQSRYTQTLLYQYEKLFLPYKEFPPSAELSIGDDRNSFSEDAKIKRTWFPSEYGYQDDVEIHELTRRIDSIQPAIRSGKMRVKLTANIAADINTHSEIKNRLTEKLESTDKVEALFAPLRKVIEVQEFAILPTYILIEMDRHGMSSKSTQKRWLDFILFKNYAQSCNEAYQSYCNNPLSIFYDHDFRHIYPFDLDYRDTNLFERFLSLFSFPKLDKPERLSITEILQIKHSDTFRMYLQSYKAFVHTLKSELQTNLLGNDSSYEALQDQMREQQIREQNIFKRQFITNVEEAIILYKILRTPFFRRQRFQTWLYRRDGELPTVQLLSCIKDSAHGILKSYMRELFEQSKYIYKTERRHNMQKNISINLGGVTVQTIQSESSGLKDGCRRSGILPEDFLNVDQEAFRTFIELLNKEQDADILVAKKALLDVMNAQYAASPEEFEEYLNSWRKKKNGMSKKLKDILQVSSQAAGIASFIFKLLGI